MVGIDSQAEPSSWTLRAGMWKQTVCLCGAGGAGTEDLVRERLLLFFLLADTRNMNRFFSKLVAIFGFSSYKKSNFYFCIIRNKILLVRLWLQCCKE